MIVNTSAASEQQNEVVVKEESAGKKWYTGKELLEMRIQEVPMLLGSFIPSTGISILSGASDCGKSTILRQLATAICGQDAEFLNHQLNVKYANVIVVSTEDDVNGVAASLTKQAVERDISVMERVRFLFDSENALTDVEKMLKEAPCDAVMIDGLGDIFNGNPNDFVAVRSFMEPWRGLSRKYGCSIIFLHHNVKNSERANPDKNKLNGSQAFESAARVVIELRQGQNLDERFLSVVKGNYVPGKEKQQSFILQFDESSLTFTNTGRRIDKADVVVVKEKGYAWLKAEALQLKSTGITNQKCLETLTAKYSEVKTPKLSWYKELED
jgi:predicted ATP-dependent serine protease